MTTQVEYAVQALQEAIGEVAAVKQQVIYASSKFSTSAKVELLLTQLGALESVRQVLIVIEAELEGNGRI